MSRKPLTDAAGEVRELTREDMAALRPGDDVLPKPLAALLRRPGQRGPGKQPPRWRYHCGFRLRSWRTSARPAPGGSAASTRPSRTGWQATGTSRPYPAPAAAALAADAATSAIDSVTTDVDAVDSGSVE